MGATISCQKYRKNTNIMLQQYVFNTVLWIVKLYCV